jgi:hypothetical protein
MAKVSISITDDLGNTTVVERIMPDVSSLDSFNTIEQFTLQVRRELFPELQSKLLSDLQKAHKKKQIKL